MAKVVDNSSIVRDKGDWSPEAKDNLLNSLCSDEVIASISDESLRKKLIDYMAHTKELKAKEEPNEKSKRKAAFISRYRFKEFSIRDLYPFNCFRKSYQRTILVYGDADGREYLCNRVFTDERKYEDNYDEGERKEIDLCRDEAIKEIVGGAEIPTGFISRKEFEENMIGPMLRVDGRILSIPREERFKLLVTYVKEWKDYLGYTQGNETQIGCIDLLTGFGGYPAGRKLSDMKESIKCEVAATTCRDLKRANLAYNFFFLDEYSFYPMSCEEVPDEWRNGCRGNMIAGVETHDFKYWRDRLLEKHGFKNIDFSFADKEETL